jgi:hypothetical protein
MTEIEEVAMTPEIETYTDDNRQVTTRTSPRQMVFSYLISEEKEDNNTKPTVAVAGPT